MKRPTSVIFGTDMPGKFTIEGNTSSYVGHFSDMLSYLEEGPQVSFSRENPNALTFLEHVFEDGDVEFKGGTLKNLLEPITDFSVYQSMLETISTNKVWKSIITQFDEQMIRRRVRSEHDGEWDYDKRFDIAPFSRREKRPQKVRIVKVVMEGSFSCNIDAETINKYGAFVTAIISLLEKNGVLVEVYSRYSTNGMCANANGDAVTLFKVKQADEYLPVSQILKAMSSLWYRRPVFGLICAHAEKLGSPVIGHLGTPKKFGTVWEIKDNTVYIYSVPSFEEQENIIKKLGEVVGV